MKRALETVKFEELGNKTFEVTLITERLCEFCDKVIDRKEKVLRMIRISDRQNYDNLLTRAKVYDRAEVDVDNQKIYFHNHDYPGAVHPSCIEKL